VTSLLLSQNNIVRINDGDIEHKDWPALYYVDIRDNPDLECDSLKNIKPPVLVITDCAPLGTLTTNFVTSKASAAVTITAQGDQSTPCTCDPISTDVTPDPGHTTPSTSRYDVTSQVTNSGTSDILVSKSETSSDLSSGSIINTESTSAWPQDDDHHVQIITILVTVISTVFISLAGCLLVYVGIRCLKYKRIRRNVHNVIYLPSTEEICQADNIELFSIEEVTSSETSV
jgi:hypothetical protein